MAPPEAVYQFDQTIDWRCRHRRSKRCSGAVRATRALSHAVLAFFASPPPGSDSSRHMHALDSACAGLARHPRSGYRPFDLVVGRLNPLSVSVLPEAL